MTRDASALTAGLESNSDPDQLALVARALVSQSDALLDRDSPGEALEILDLVIAGLSRHAERESKKVTALALASKSVALNRLGRDDAMLPFETMTDHYAAEALAAFDEEATRLWSAVTPLQLKRLAWALLTEAMILSALERRSESQAVLKQLLDRFDGRNSPAVGDTVEAAHRLLRQLSHPEPN